MPVSRTNCLKWQRCARASSAVPEPAALCQSLALGLWDVLVSAPPLRVLSLVTVCHFL